MCASEYPRAYVSIYVFPYAVAKSNQIKFHLAMQHSLAYANARARGDMHSRMCATAFPNARRRYFAAPDPARAAELARVRARRDEDMLFYIIHHIHTSNGGRCWRATSATRPSRRCTCCLRRRWIRVCILRMYIRVCILRIPGMNIRILYSGIRVRVLYVIRVLRMRILRHGVEGLLESICIRVCGHTMYKRMCRACRYAFTYAGVCIYECGCACRGPWRGGDRGRGRPVRGPCAFGYAYPNVYRHGAGAWSCSWAPD